MVNHKADADPLTDVTQFLGSEYLSAKDVEDGDLTFAISAVSREQFEAKKGQKKEKPRVVVTCEGDPIRKLSCNATNLQTFMDAWGTNAHAWVGKVFDAYFDKTVRDPSGKQTGGLRVRVRDVPLLATVRPGAGANGSGIETESADESIPF